MDNSTTAAGLQCGPSGAMVRLVVAGPLTIQFSADSGELTISHTQKHPDVLGGITHCWTFRRGATLQLAGAMKRIAVQLDQPAKAPSVPSSRDQMG